MMKITFKFFLFSLLFISCNKQTNEDDASGSTMITSFKFTLNGTTHEVSGSLATNSTAGSKIEKDPYTNKYTFEAYKFEQGVRKFFVIFPLPDDIAVGTYNYTYGNGRGGEVGIAGLQRTYCIVKSGDNHKINITKVENGFVSGTYSSTQLSICDSSPNLTGTIQITNGEFKNVQILK